MTSSFGVLFRSTTWGESHGGGVGVVVDGCPPGIPVSIEAIQRELDRRRPGQSELTTPRAEADQVEVLSGLLDGLTLGTPINILVRNRDHRSADYDELKEVFRPSHADFTYQRKYGLRDWRGGGRASARETVGRVAAGAVARRVLAELFGVEILAYTKTIGTLCAEVDLDAVTAADVEANAVRCPDASVAVAMIESITEAKAAGDSLGGIIECVARGVPPGWGEPVFDKLEADLAKALLSIPACKGFEIGSGFAGTELSGSEHNDSFISVGDGISTATNRSGGVQGGISNGAPIVLRAAFKPTATIAKPQQTVDVEGTPTTLAASGRHDPCVLPRAVPIVEAMVGLVLVDHALRQRGLVGSQAES